MFQEQGAPSHQQAAYGHLQWPAQPHQQLSSAGYQQQLPPVSQGYQHPPAANPSYQMPPHANGHQQPPTVNHNTTFASMVSALSEATLGSIPASLASTSREAQFAIV